MQKNKYMRDGKMDYENLEKDTYEKIRYSQDEMAKELSSIIVETIKVDNIRSQQYGEITLAFKEIREEIKKMKEKLGLE